MGDGRKGLTDEHEEEVFKMRGLVMPGRLVTDAAEEIMLLWALRQPLSIPQNIFVNHTANSLCIDACGHQLNILQSPSSMNQSGVTGGVMWDSGVVLGKFIEHAVDSGLLRLQGKKCVELGAGCGLVGCIAALLGGHVIMTDLFDRLKLLEKNVDENVNKSGVRGTAEVRELVWGDDLDSDLLEPLPDYVFGSDVIYNEEAVHDLIHTIQNLCGIHTVALIDDIVLEYFLDHALKAFDIACIEPSIWHPDYRSYRTAIFMMSRK
eukprot:TRINITY_DN1023_c0_g1_i2.p1 TRINITY_DN1023_c0_g1~~TRINITY_DN1023_c0_g1_i2.p1  ORF type:complete len:264 (+),score=50.08 TRINITY_DN1023_c0_g1_i2:177-968(+)